MNPAAPAPPGTHRAAWAVAGIVGLFLLSCVFSWPWAGLDGTVIPTRQFDLYGMLWVIEHARELLPELRSTISGLPDGEDLRRLDTWVLLGIAIVTDGALSPLRLAQTLVVIGPVLGGLAAERCAARGLGIRRPWSFVAAVIWGLNGLGATALLEGHVYSLFDPWLPLLAWALLAGTGPGGRLRHGCLAGVAWSLALGTSAYIGLIGALLAAALLLRGLLVRVDRQPVGWTALGFVGVAGPIGLAYTHLFGSGTGSVASDPSTVLAGGSATLATLATWSPSVDLSNHSIAAPLGFVPLALLVVAPLVLRAERGWRTLAILALGSVILALGPTVQVGLGGRGTWFWVDLTSASPSLGFLHFPIRFLWLWYLCAGLVAARVCERLHARLGVRALPLLALVAVDALATTGVPWRIGTVPAPAPSAYAATPDAAVLDLLPEDPHPGSGTDLWVRRLACWYQVSHARPVPGRCLGPHGATPQEAAERALRRALLDGTDPTAAITALDVGSVAVHADLFSPEDRVNVLSTLTTFYGAPVATSTDAGETLVVFGVER